MARMKHLMTINYPNASFGDLQLSECCDESVGECLSPDRA